MRIQALGFLAAACIVLSGVAEAAPFDFDHAFGRLPKNVVPVDYAIAVTPNIPAGTFTGTESIALKFRSATKTIQFNTLNEFLWDVRLDGKPVAKVDTENGVELTTLTLAAAPKIGMHRLTFAYAGRLETAPQGLFVQRYRKDDGSASLIDCDDVRVDRRAPHVPVLGRAVVPRDVQTHHDRPGRMEHRCEHAARDARRARDIGDDDVPALAQDADVPGGVRGGRPRDGERNGCGDAAARRCGQRTGARGYTAIANGKAILADYNDYFDFKFPLPKLDLIAMPGGFQGGMENWGAIVFTDSALLIDANSHDAGSAGSVLRPSSRDGASVER